MADDKNKLQLKFDPRTIEHLGIKMYSQLPYALAELVANAYDAAASTVKIELTDKTESKSIRIIDDGEGMSYDEVKDNFLVIGRKRRDDDANRTNSKGRKITGKKGLGKLALFGIGKTIEINTTKSGEAQRTVFILDWDAILSESSGTYYPETRKEDKKMVTDKGTTITLSNLSRFTPFDLESTAIALSKLFDCFGRDFMVSISQNGSAPTFLSRDMKYHNLNKEFEWDLKDIINEIVDEYPYKTELKGRIISTKTPIKQDLRGITLYVNGRLANVPSYFGVSEAGHTFSYLSGWIDADYLDEFEKDIIATDRQSLSWDMPDADELQKYLQKIVKFLVKDWSAKRKKAKTDSTSKRAGINITDWYEKVPNELRTTLTSVIDTISEKPEINDEDYSAVVRKVYDLIPPYTYFHYRLLNEQVQDASKKHYEAKDYYEAFLEAMKRYKNSVKAKAELTCSEDRDIVASAFGIGKPLVTTAKYAGRPNGQPFDTKTIENIEEGQKFLSIGVVCGGRNVLSHEEIVDLKDTGLFSEKDCLDMLSILSHLYRRLDESEKR